MICTCERAVRAATAPLHREIAELQIELGNANEALAALRACRTAADLQHARERDRIGDVDA